MRYMDNSDKYNLNREYPYNQWYRQFVNNDDTAVLPLAIDMNGHTLHNGKNIS